MRNSRLWLVSLLSAGMFSSLSCSRSQNAVLTIQLPEAATPLSSKIVSSLTSNSFEVDEEIPWNGVSISSSSEINCYVVMVGGPEQRMSRNRCWNGSGQILFTFGPFEGGVEAGSTIELDVSPGSGRNIYLLGMKADSGYCTSFKNEGPSENRISYPRLVAQTTMDLTPGDNTVTLNVPADISSRPQIQNCKVDETIGDGEADLKTKIFGNGRDGDLTITSDSSAISVNSASYGDSGLSHAINNSFGHPVPNTKIFSANRQVVGVENLGHTLSLGSTFGAEHFDLGDEVMWYVSEGDVSSGVPDDGACGTGSELYRGRYDFAHIVGVDTTNQKITLSRSISPNPSAIISTNLTATAASGSAHCRIQVVRVPSFNTLTVASGDIDAILRPPAYNPVTGTGGILVFRAQKIEVLSSDSSLTLNLTGKGYPGGSSGYAGAGVEGPSNSSSANGAGGGSSGSDGAGGANAGNGGNSSMGGTGGTPIHYCQDESHSPSACLPMRDRKAFLGGGGGSGSSTNGAGGGGIAMIYVYEVSADSTLNIEASGASISGTEGGGAGGSIHFSNVKGNSAPISLTASGSFGSNGGGGGGGGVVEHIYCSNNSPTFTATALGGVVTGSPLGTAGDNGLSINQPSPLYCGL